MSTNVISIAPYITEVKRAGVTVALLGANLVVAAVAGKRIRVLGVVAATTLANSIKFQSAATDISGLFPLAANGQFPLDFNQHGWFETAVGEALNINLSVATSTGLQLAYLEV